MKANPTVIRPVGRHRTPVEIRSILQLHRRSGLSLLAFARRHELCYPTLLRWRTRSAAAHTGPGSGQSGPGGDLPDPGFVPVQVEPGAPLTDFVLVWAPERSLRIPPGFDPVQLRHLLDALGMRP